MSLYIKSNKDIENLYNLDDKSYIERSVKRLHSANDFETSNSKILDVTESKDNTYIEMNPNLN